MYKLTAPLPGAVFGAAVSGVRLDEHTPAPVIAQIKADLLAHKLLVFKDQGDAVSAERQLAVSRWFGDVESTFFKHPHSPHPDVFRVSNDEAEGCTQVGRSGWHIDGSFQPRPFKVQTMTFWSVSRRGQTLFSPLEDVVARLSPGDRDEWERLSVVTNSPARDGSGLPVIHPLVYAHPDTGKATLCFHCGAPFVRSFAKDLSFAGDGRGGTRRQASASDVYGPERTAAMRGRIAAALEDPAVCYAHDWALGEFAIIDNLAVGHYAHPDTQESVEAGGLRVLHRTTVAGTNVPKKTVAA